MPFDLSTTGRVLNFENTPYAGLTVKCDEAPIGLLTDIAKDYSKLIDPALAASPEGAELLDRLMENFAMVLEEWDLTRKGEPVPATLDGIRSVGSTFFMTLIRAWLTGTVQVDDDLGKGSASGGTSPEALAAMAALSSALPSSGPQRL